MKKIFLTVLSIALIMQAFSALASGEHEEASPNVGPNKGITAADEHDGIQLSAEAIKNFALQTQKLNSGAQIWEVSAHAVFVSGEEVNVYRLREGFYKRVDFETLSKTSEKIKIKSKDLKGGDEVVITGLGFLRAAELSAFSSGEEGHGH